MIIKSKLLKENLLKCEGKIIDCIIRNDDFLKFNDRITFEFDNKNSTYAFNNNSNEDIYLIAPFYMTKTGNQIIQKI